MKAVKITSKGHAAVLSDVPIPSLPDQSYLLIKTIAVALNPTDWKHIGFTDPINGPTTIGCDYAGIVEAVGSAVTRPFKKGDRVWGFVHGANKLKPDGGAFQEYVVAKAGTVIKIPDGVSFESAATAGVGTLTVGQGLYQEMGLPWPDKPLKPEEKKQILIWGGSSATGAIGIQFAKLSGFEVITTCAKSNFDYVKSLGADVVFDSRSPTAGADIRAYTNNKLYYAWDCIGEHKSPRQCGDALASSPPPNSDQKIHYGSILLTDDMFARDDIVNTWSLGYTATGEIVEIADWKFEAKPGDYEFLEKWTPVVEKLLSEGKWKTHRMEVREGGLDGILSGLEDMKQGKISGLKVVYRVAEA